MSKIDVKPISNGSGTIGYVAKGHISKEKLEAAIRLSWNDKFKIGDLLIEHTVMRCIPTPYTDEYDFIYEYSEPGRGAFKCTTVYL